MEKVVRGIRISISHGQAPEMLDGLALVVDTTPPSEEFPNGLVDIFYKRRLTPEIVAQYIGNKRTLRLDDFMTVSGRNVLFHMFRGEPSTAIALRELLSVALEEACE